MIWNTVKGVLESRSAVVDGLPKTRPHLWSEGSILNIYTRRDKELLLIWNNQPDLPVLNLCFCENKWHHKYAGPGAISRTTKKFRALHRGLLLSLRKGWIWRRRRVTVGVGSGFWFVLIFSRTCQRSVMNGCHPSWEEGSSRSFACCSKWVEIVAHYVLGTNIQYKVTISNSPSLNIWKSDPILFK